jgi:diketogulonate reductase-like aldo/keto reductase
MHRVTLASGESVPALGQGTWRLGDDPARRAQEIGALRRGIDLGLALIDTAEMYGEGASEQLVGEAIRGRRDEVFVVTKVYPWNASRRAMPRSCEASVRRLGIDCIDLYLLHWPGNVPLQETVDAFEDLKHRGRIRHWGVSNFDTGAMEELWSLPGGRAAQANQVLYNLAHRGVEWDLQPWLRQRGLPLMAYSPLNEGKLPHMTALVDFAGRHGMTPSQAALAWLLQQDGVIAIPKTVRPDRVEDYAGALAHRLTREQRAELDAVFAPPRGPVPLEMI